MLTNEVVKREQSGTITFPKVKRCTNPPVAEAFKAVIRALEKIETTKIDYLDDNYNPLHPERSEYPITLEEFKKELLYNLNIELEKYYVED